MKEPCLPLDDDGSVTSLPYDKVFKELSKLEKDFRHQETQNKIKKEELDKMSVTTKILKQHLETAYSEIECLRNQIQELEAKLDGLERDSNQEKEFCEKVVQKLTCKVASMTAEHKEVLERSNTILEETRTAIQEKHVNFVNDLQMKHGEELIELEKQLHLAASNSRQLQTKLDVTLEDNLILQDKLRKAHQEYLPIEAYKAQLQILSTSNDKLKNQFQHLKNECHTLYKENVCLKGHVERLNSSVNSHKEQEQQFKVQKDLLLLTQQQLIEFKEKYHEVVVECEHLKESNSNLTKEVDSSKIKGQYCNVDNHRNIIQQNQILQDLVKEMRKEREKLQCLPDAEERIKRLEELIVELKKVLISNLLN